MSRRKPRLPSVLACCTADTGLFICVELYSNTRTIFLLLSFLQEHDRPTKFVILNGETSPSLGLYDSYVVKNRLESGIGQMGDN